MKTSSKRTIAETVVDRLRRSPEPLDVNRLISGPTSLDDLRRRTAAHPALRGLHPAHAAYAYAQHHISESAEHLSRLDETSALVDLVATAEDEYMPSRPPMSPLTWSYFFSWATFDACVGAARETFATVLLEVGAAFGMGSTLMGLVRTMQSSRMGIYVHEGLEGNRVILRERVTDQVFRALVPAGHRGQKGELWYARVLPPAYPGADDVVFCTPYVLLQPGLQEWDAYFRRILPASSKSALDAYERHMKYGPGRTYWNEFVFEGYVNHRNEVIFLAGLPDVAASRPHSRVNSRPVLAGVFS